MPGIAEIARRNVERANAKGRGTGRVHVVAAGAERGSAEIVLAAQNHGDNRVVDDPSGAADLEGGD